MHSSRLYCSIQYKRLVQDIAVQDSSIADSNIDRESNRVQVKDKAHGLWLSCIAGIDIGREIKYSQQQYIASSIETIEGFGYWWTEKYDVGQ